MNRTHAEPALLRMCALRARRPFRGGGRARGRRVIAAATLLTLCRLAPAQSLPSSAAESHAPDVRSLPSSLRVQRVRVDSTGTQLLESVQLERDGAGARSAPATTIAEGGDPEEILVYSNTLGRTALGFGPFARLSDDIHLTVASGAVLSRFTFVVDGAINGGSGPFSVNFVLYDACPSFRGQIIEGTEGSASLPDGGTYLVEFVPEGDVILPDAFRLSLTFSRAGAGWVAGAPPLLGYSDNFIDYTFFGCEVEFAVSGVVHSSFDAEVFVRPPAEPRFFAYRARTRPAAAFLPQAGERYADDLTLDVDACLMTSYEIDLRGDGEWEIDLREDDGGVPGDAIPGSAQSATTSGNPIVTARVDFDPPVPVASKLWVTVGASGLSPNVMQADLPANVGFGSPSLVHRAGDGWLPVSAAADATFRVSVRCAGESPVGACCDMEFLSASGDPVCRQVPRLNCPFPRWVEGVACVPEPFTPPCGAAACCLANGSCENRTILRCTVGGTDWFRDSICGEELPRECPGICPVSENACTFAHGGVGCREASCCRNVCDRDSFCCQFEWDATCARRAHDACATRPSNDTCQTGRPRQDGAKAIELGETIVADLTNATTSTTDPGFCCHAGFDTFCEGGCRDGMACDTSEDCVGTTDGVCNEEGFCEGGCGAGSECAVDEDCPGTPAGTCPQQLPLPGEPAAGSSWFQLTLPSDRKQPLSVEITTCANDPPADDSMLAVWKVADPDRGVCDRLGRCLDGSPCEISDDICADGSLCRESIEPCSRSANDCPGGTNCVMDLGAACGLQTPLACADDAPSCGPVGKNAAVCLPNLAPGTAMLIQLGAKTAASRGSYNLTASEVASCNAALAPASGAACGAPRQLTPGMPAPEVSLSAFQCETGDCVASPQRGAWLRLEPDRGGELVLTTEMANDVDHVSVEWHDGCGCGTDRGPSLCTTMVSTDRIVARRDVAGGKCYLVRISTGETDAVSATVRAEFAADAACPPASITLVDPPANVTDARQPARLDETSARRLTIMADAATGKLGGPSCWSVCEPDRSDAPNGVVDVSDLGGGGEFRVTLLRPVTAGAETVLTYHDEFGGVASVRLVSLPGDVGGDGISGAPDIIDLIDGLRDGTLEPASGDLNRDGTIGPSDIITLIDLLNGASGFEAWLGRSAASSPACFQ